MPALIPAPQAPSRPARVREREADRDQRQAEPVVEVSIGRIEVRAVFPEPQPVAPRRRAVDSALSLADYLKQRDRGAR